MSCVSCTRQAWCHPQRVVRSAVRYSNADKDWEVSRFRRARPPSRLWRPDTGNGKLLHAQAVPGRKKTREILVLLGLERYEATVFGSARSRHDGGGGGVEASKPTLAAFQAARSLADDGTWRSLARATIVPLATLIVLAVGYRVPLFVLRPFLAPPAMMAYRWLFVLAIIGTALWFAVATYRRATVLGAVVARLAHSVRSKATTCEGTGAAVAAATARWTMRRHGRARRRLLSELRPRTGRVIVVRTGFPLHSTAHRDCSHAASKLTSTKASSR